MNRILSALLAAGLAGSCLGCQSGTELDTQQSEATAPESVTSDLTLVTLKVPNMT